MQDRFAKYRKFKDIKALYERGGNIMQYLRGLDGQSQNDVQDILLSYDLQSGVYIERFLKNREFKEQYGKKLAGVLDSLGAHHSILEAGTGEGIMLHLVAKYLQNQPEHWMGFDISWSRLKYAKHLLKTYNQEFISLFTANLFAVPLADNAIDVVFTSHAIEPNGGKEKEALQALYRVASKYLVLLEPDYALADETGKKRMKDHGFIGSLAEAAQDLGYNIVTHEPFGLSSNPQNPTGLLIIKKEPVQTAPPPAWVCPITEENLKSIEPGFLGSDNGGFVYPVLSGIPCLLAENAILATHYFNQPTPIN